MQQKIYVCILLKNKFQENNIRIDQDEYCIKINFETVVSCFKRAVSIISGTIKKQFI